MYPANLVSKEAGSTGELLVSGLTGAMTHQRSRCARALVFGTTGLDSVLSGMHESKGGMLVVSKGAECEKRPKSFCTVDTLPSSRRPETRPEGLLSQVQSSSRAGEKAFRHGQTSAALSHLKKAYLLSQDHPCAQQKYRCSFNLAAAYLLASEPRKALQHLLRWQQCEGCPVETSPNCSNGSDILSSLSKSKDPDFHFNLGLAYEGMGCLADALGCYQAAVELHGCGDPGGQADARVKGAYCQLALGHRGPPVAQSFALAAQGYRQAGRGEEAAMALIEAANQMVEGGKGLHCEEAGRGVTSLLQDCLQLCRQEVKDDRLRVKLQTDVGLLLCALGSFRKAEHCLLEALAVCEEEEGAGLNNLRSGSIRQRAVLLQNLGAVLNAQGRYATAMALHSKARVAFRLLGQRHGEAECLGNMASACHHMGRYQVAAQLYQEALTSFTQAGDPRAQRLMREGMTAALLHLAGGGRGGGGGGDAGGGGWF